MFTVNISICSHLLWSSVIVVIVICRRSKRIIQIGGFSLQKLDRPQNTELKSSTSTMALLCYGRLLFQTFHCKFRDLQVKGLRHVLMPIDQSSFENIQTIPFCIYPSSGITHRTCELFSTQHVRSRPYCRAGKVGRGYSAF